MSMDRFAATVPIRRSARIQSRREDQVAGPATDTSKLDNLALVAFAQSASDRALTSSEFAKEIGDSDPERLKLAEDAIRASLFKRIDAISADIVNQRALWDDHISLKEAAAAAYDAAHTFYTRVTHLLGIGAGQHARNAMETLSAYYDITDAMMREQLFKLVQLHIQRSKLMPQTRI